MHQQIFLDDINCQKAIVSLRLVAKLHERRVLPLYFDSDAIGAELAVHTTRESNIMYQQISSTLTQRVLDDIARQPTRVPELEVLRLVALTGLHPQALVGLRPASIGRRAKSNVPTRDGR